MNLIAFLHAWRFTHFTEGSIPKPDGDEMSFGNKLTYLFTGIPNPRPSNKALPGQPFESVVLESNRSISCWWIENDSSIGTVILLHGYGGEKSGLLDKSDLFQQMGFNTLLVDFMGSGDSEGNKTSIGFHEARQVQTAFEWAQRKTKKPVYVFGSSMGAVAALRAIAIHHISPAVLIIECPFGTLYQTTKARFRQMGVPSFPMASLLVFWGGVQQGFNGFKHNPVEYAKSTDTPTLLLYGLKDPKVSLVETEKIFENLKGDKSKIYFPEAGHENYLIKYRKEWAESVSDFLSNNFSLK